MAALTGNGLAAGSGMCGHNDDRAGEETTEWMTQNG